MLTVKKTKRLDNKKPAQVARKFRIPIDDVRELQRGETVELEDTLARTLKQWGMVAYVTIPVPPAPVEEMDTERSKFKVNYNLPDDKSLVDDEA